MPGSALDEPTRDSHLLERGVYQAEQAIDILDMLTGPHLASDFFWIES